MIATLRDITERKKAELYLNLVNVILVALDREGNITLLNKKGYEILGFKEGELIGKNWFDNFIKKENREDIRLVFNQLMAGGVDPVEYYENPVLTKEGNEKTIAWHNTILKDDQGKIIGTLSSGEDITIRKIAEQKLKESEEKYKYLADELEMIIDHIPGLVFFKDTKNNFIRVNKYHADAHNLQKEDMEGVSCFDIYPKEQAQAYWDDDLEVINTKKPKLNIIEPWESPEGTRWALTSKIPYFDEGGKIKGIIGFAADITERKKSDEKLKESEEKYREAYNRANFYKDLFAHDINNILQNIISASELSSIYLNNVEKREKLSEAIDIVKEQVKKGAGLISKVRKLSEIEESQLTLEPTNICEVLKSSIDYSKKSFQSRDINIEINSFRDNIYIQANSLVSDLVENIIINSITHNRSPQIEINIKISKKQQDGNNYIKIEFIDNGVGIPDDQKKFIFEKKTDGYESGRGMGLGLSLVKKIIDNYNGQIWVEDRVKGDYSKGSNFVLLIPEAE